MSETKQPETGAEMERNHFDWTPLFRERVARLARLVELRAPACVVASDVLLVYRAAWCCMAEQMGSVTAGHELQVAREAAGFCPFCGATDLGVGVAGMCAACTALATDGDDIDAEPVAEPSPEPR